MANLSEGRAYDYPGHHRAAGGLKETQEITCLAEAAGFDASA